MVELLDFGISYLAGEEVRPMMHRPSREELRRGVEEHLRSIRQYGSSTGESLYFLTDGCWTFPAVYTRWKQAGIIAKTAAGDWALERGLCPVPGTLREGTGGTTLSGGFSYRRGGTPAGGAVGGRGSAVRECFGGAAACWNANRVRRWFWRGACIRFLGVKEGRQTTSGAR